MIRLARRDVGRHRGRSILTALLVALPVMIVAAATTVLATAHVDAQESLNWNMGTTSAALKVEPKEGPVTQSPDGETSNAVAHFGDAPRPAKALPDTKTGEQPTASAVQRVTGGTVRTTTQTNHRAVLGERRPKVSMLGIDGRDRAYDGMATLTSGHWPRAADEVLVSSSGRVSGLPTSGAVQVTDHDRKTQQLRVVGTVDTPYRQALVGLPRSGGETSFLLDRQDPVRWAEVERLNKYGAAVQSRYLIEHPERAALSPQAAQQYTDAGSTRSTEVPLLVAGLVIVIAMLAGPAFSTGGARERHVLAQLGCNGATRSMLRRYVLAKAVVLGAASAILGVVLGGGLGAVVVAVASRRITDQTWGPLDLRFGYGLALAGIAIVAALVAALIPAVQASRVSIIQVLRGLVSSRRVRTGWPLLGLVACLASGAFMINGAKRSSGGETGVALAAVALFVGALITLPWLLSQVGRLASQMPLPLRLAMRDVGRQRGRSVSGVAAIMACVAMMTALAIGGTSDDQQAQRDHQRQAPMGQAVIEGKGSELGDAAAAVRRDAPDVEVRTISRVGKVATAHAAKNPGGAGGEPRSDFVLAAPPRGCALPDAMNPDGKCAGMASSVEMGSDIAVMPAATARSYAGLSAAQTKGLEDGAVLVAGNPLAAERVAQVDSGPTVSFEWGSATVGAGEISSYSRHSGAALPSISLDPDPTSPLTTQGIAMVVTPATAADHGWPTTPTRLALSSPGGLTKAQVTRVSEQAPDNTRVEVERGPDTTTATLIIRIMMTVIGLLILAAALIGTALTQADSRPDQATLAAVGATGRLRRLVAGSQAATIGLTGALLGLALGVVSGVAVAYPLTSSAPLSEAPVEPLIAIPWVDLTAVVIGVPVVAAFLAAAAMRREPTLARRPS